MSNDPYIVLGLSKAASAADIKKAYRKLARTHHPDLNPGDAAAERKFKAASVAYDLLKDPDTRALFDRGEIDASGAQQRPQGQHYQNYGQQRGHGFQSNQGFGDMGDIFADMMRQRGQSLDARGQDARFTLELDFLEAVKGGKKAITLPAGDQLEVAIPQGVADGQTIRLRGKGGAGRGKGPRGDAHVTLKVRMHSVFSRDGDDILVTLPITIDEAILGGKIPTPTIDGIVQLNIPKGASSGQTLRLRGRGVVRKGKPAGDQKVKLSIISPPAIDAELQEFMQKWREKNCYDPREEMT